MTDTKQQWKRRALKAEHELAIIHKIRRFEHAQELDNARMLAVLQCAMKEIADSVDYARDIYSSIDSENHAKV